MARKNHRGKGKTLINPETGQRISRKKYRQQRKEERRMMKDSERE